MRELNESNPQIRQQIVLAMRQQIVLAMINEDPKLKKWLRSILKVD